MSLFPIRGSKVAKNFQSRELLTRLIFENCFNSKKIGCFDFRSPFEKSIKIQKLNSMGHKNISSEFFPKFPSINLKNNVFDISLGAAEWANFYAISFVNLFKSFTGKFSGVFGTRFF